MVLTHLLLSSLLTVSCNIESPSATGNITTMEQVDSSAMSYSPLECYVKPEDPEVLKKIDQWQDLKFGVLFHWGIYSVPGMMESWNLCSEDVRWEYQFREEHGMTYTEFKDWYWGLSKQFNPTKFDPTIWADIMQDAGMKYMVFTTKHHDGFCMFDSKYSDYKITNGPFASNPRSNITKEVLNAFRDKGFMVGEYFSKPDWHCKWYWNPLFATPNRMQNYDRDKHPDWWNKYVEFTMNQLTELTTDYGHIDILWLDGGQIRGAEVNIGEVLKEARKRHPGLICADRCSRDKYEEYQTPEHEIPREQRNIPWETNTPLLAWGWRYNPVYRTTRTIISELVEVVAKGGNYLLGIGPSPWGTIDDMAQQRLREIGDWMRRNGEAIYSTRVTSIYHDGNLWFTASKDGSTIYGIYALPNDEELPQTIEWSGNLPIGTVTSVDGGKMLKSKIINDKVVLTVPKGVRQEAFVFKFRVK